MSPRNETVNRNKTERSAKDLLRLGPTLRSATGTHKQVTWDRPVSNWTITSKKAELPFPDFAGSECPTIYTKQDRRQNKLGAYQFQNCNLPLVDELVVVFSMLLQLESGSHLYFNHPLVVFLLGL